MNTLPNITTRGDNVTPPIWGLSSDTILEARSSNTGMPLKFVPNIKVCIPRILWERKKLQTTLLKTTPVFTLPNAIQKSSER